MINNIYVLSFLVILMIYNIQYMLIIYFKYIISYDTHVIILLIGLTKEI